MRSLIIEHLNRFPDIAERADKLLDSIFMEKWTEKEKEALVEEDAVVQCPITVGIHHGGIDTTYWFSTKHGTVEVYIGDSPEDHYAKIIEKQLQLVNLK